MAISLGIDTGGTYTDAVLIKDDTDILARAKALTTRQDLAIGVGAAVRMVLSEASIDASVISLASLSTTLATNALVEGQGGRVAFGRRTGGSCCADLYRVFSIRFEGSWFVRCIERRSGLRVRGWSLARWS